MERRSRTPTFLRTLNIATVLDHDVNVVEIRLAMRIICVLVIVVIVVANQTRVRLNGVGAEMMIYR
jgi:hypothetical protein